MGGFIVFKNNMELVSGKHLCRRRKYRFIGEMELCKLIEGRELKKKPFHC